MSAGLVIEPARFAVTGGIPCGMALGMRLEYIGTDSGPLDAPEYTPTGAVSVACHGYAVTTTLRDGVFA